MTLTPLFTPQKGIILFPFYSNFCLTWTKSRKSYCTTPGVGIGDGVGVCVSKKFNVKVFYMMGVALSGELSCPCDRSCYLFSLVLAFFLSSRSLYPVAKDLIRFGWPSFCLLLR